MLKEKWEQFSLAEQMANIGSEVNRIIILKDKGDRVHFRGSVERAIDLIDLTIAKHRGKSGCVKELLRLREILADYFFETFNFSVSGRELNNYFLPFAFLARKDK